MDKAHFLEDLIETQSYHQQRNRKAISRRHEIFVRKVIMVIYQHLDNHQLDVSLIADHLCLSVSQLNRKLNTILHLPAGHLIRQIRMQEAATFLTHDMASVGEIAWKVGYKNHANFCRSFKQYYGCTPTEYTHLQVSR
ncbi:MAG: helix-turn-helix transcriptional regulator [Bacteroidota bacterium]